MLPAAQAALTHDKLLASIDSQIMDVQAQIKTLIALKNDLAHTRRQLAAQPDSVILAEPFIHRCADSDCNGFVSSAWKCGICDKYTCHHCRELKADRYDHDHVCNPDTVASVSLLKNDTKPCPNCKVLVHKTEGCDQMFCTQCKRLWSWNSGQFETRGHNPHYLQWMRENHAGGMPRETGEVVCGREIDHHFLLQLQRDVANLQLSLMARKQWNHDIDIDIAKHFGAIFSMLSSIPHLRFHELQRFNVDRIAINLTARKAFLANTLSLTKFKQTILRNHLLALKNEHISQIIHAMIQASTDIAFRFHHETRTQPQTHTLTQWTRIAHHFAQELFNLKSYANHELSLIHADFHSTPSKISFFATLDFKLINILKPSTSSYHDTRFTPFITHLRR
jgi:hypothetical protein